ncbi:hypothetical protein GQ54DRAFT_341412 [Martensiomyces pterosporus]|nr:hypothetical protein GQ54DRAFT_341412 [Martensiomyces pterosporus]
MPASSGRTTPASRATSTERRLERTKSVQSRVETTAAHIRPLAKPTAQQAAIYGTRHKRSDSVTSNGSANGGSVTSTHRNQRPFTVADGFAHTSATQRTPTNNVPLASRPIATARSRRYPNPNAEMLADGGNSGQNDSSARVAQGHERSTQRSLRRYNSTGVSRSQSPPLPPQQPAQTTAAAEGNSYSLASAARRTPQTVNGFGSQRSATAGATNPSSYRRLRASPSAGDMGATRPSRIATKHSTATPTPRAANSGLGFQEQRQQPPSRGPSRSGVYGGGYAASNGRTGSFSTNKGKSSRSSSPAPFRFTSRPPPSPSANMNATASSQQPSANGSRASRIPRLPSASDTIAPPRRLLHDQYYELMQRLKVEQETNNELMEELRSVASYTELLGGELEQARLDATEAKSRTAQAESALDEQKAVNLALESKIAALSALICAQAGMQGAASDKSLPSPLKSQVRGLKDTISGAIAQTDGDDDDFSAAEGASVSEQPQPSENWRADRARILAEIGAIHATCTLAKPESEMDEAAKCDLCLVEQYLDRATNDSSISDMQRPTGGKAPGNSRFALPALQSPPGPRRVLSGGSANGILAPSFPHLVTPVQRKIAEQEERAKRRRSTVMFAGLIRPSNGPTSLLGSRDFSTATPQRGSVAEDGTQLLPCGRCQQLLETLQALEIDNDYYREANGKLRDSIADVVSKHNALVRLFERERMRRRENRASALAEASRIAARDRAVLEAQQRAELEETIDARTEGSFVRASSGTVDGDLASEFERALSIVTPAAARHKLLRARTPVRAAADDPYVGPASATSPIHP